MARRGEAVSMESRLDADAAQVYDDFFVPALFAQWADRVAEAARVRSGQRVLDVACGTGALTRAVKNRSGTGGVVIGLDPNAAMLNIAARKSPDIEWQQGTAESLPFESGTFDAVVSQFGLMFVADRLYAAAEGALHEFADDDGSVSLRVPAHLVTATRI